MRQKSVHLNVLYIDLADSETCHWEVCLMTAFSLSSAEKSASQERSPELPVGRIRGGADELFRSMADAAPILIWVTDAAGRVIFLNRAWLEFTGRTLAEELNHGWTSHIHPEDAQAVIDKWLGVCQMRETFVLEYRLRVRDGTYHWIMDWGAPRYLEDGTFVGYIGSAADINERKKAEAVSKESETRYRQLAEGMPQIVWISDPSGNSFYYNPQWYEYTGRRFPETDWRPVMHPDDLALTEATWEHSVATGTPYEIQYRLRHHSGSFRWFLARGLPLRDKEGNVLHWFGSCTDIDDQKRLTEQVKRINEELERRVRIRTEELELANRELEAFSYSVSHDLRAPLRSIEGFSDALLKQYSEALDEEGQNYLNRVKAAAHRLSDLIDGMLDLSRISRRELNRQLVDLSHMVGQIAMELQSSDPARHVQFKIMPAVSAQADPILIRSVLENLMSNAWKFTGKHPEAIIEFGCEANANPTVYFIRDDGVGFNMAYAARIFGAFQRLHGTMEFPGTGIGLATVQRIIRRHGGRIWAEGEVERGATFRFTLEEEVS